MAVETTVRRLPIWTVVQRVIQPAPEPPAAAETDPWALQLPLDPQGPLGPLVSPQKPSHKPKPRPKKPPKPHAMTVKELPRALDVTYGGISKGPVTHTDMIATSATAHAYLYARSHHKILGDVVKSWDWFDKNGRLKLNSRQIADQLSAPYSKTLGGKRPQGADAVVFDEVNDRLNVAPQTFARGLAMAKKRHPDRPLIVYMSHPDRLNPILLRAVEKYADRVLVENYLWESDGNHGQVSPSLFDKDYAPIARIAPGILKKAHPVLAISEKPGPYNFNNLSSVDFHKFLNNEAYALKHNRYTRHMKGLGAYATYEATPGTLRFYDRLVHWYSNLGHSKKMRD